MRWARKQSSERAHGCIPHPRSDPYAIHILSTHLSPSPPPQAFLPFSPVSHDDQSLDSLAFVLLTHPCHVRTDAEGRRWSARGVDPWMETHLSVCARWKGWTRCVPGAPAATRDHVRGARGRHPYGALSFWTWRQMVRRVADSRRRRFGGLARDPGSPLKAPGHPAD